MCGVVGKIAWNQNSRVSTELLSSMAEQLRHRGPDEGGVWVEGPVGLAMKRLKIRDLIHGQQPMNNAHCPCRAKSGPLTLVYNGEIYGTEPLKTRLQKQGHVFNSSSDTEIILHAFEEYGEEAWNHLNGMFGLAIYSEKQKALYVVRDPMGIKPFYYRATPHSFSFASEIKALLADPETSREWNPQSVNEFFSLRYVPTPRSIYKEIAKLEPGRYLKVTAQGVEKKTYWTFNPTKTGREPLGYYKEQLDSLLEQSIKSHLVSDVPLGVFLSGGLDSTTVAAYVQRAGQSLNSFTIYFSDKSFSEQHEAKLVAERYGLNHNEMEVHPDLPTLAPKLGAIFDEPFADPSIIPTYSLCEFAKSKVTVTLSGDGGDELLGGYPTYIADRVSRYYRFFPKLVQKFFQQAAQMLPVSLNRISFDYKVKAFLAVAGRQQPHAHFGWQEMFFPQDKAKLFNRDFWESVKEYDPGESFVRAYTEAEVREDLERLLYLDQRTHMLDEYLVKVDRLSMAHSLEVRVPLLDRSLVEFAASIPPAYKILGMNTKVILRKLMEDKLPEEVIKGFKKGFTPPLGRWFAGDLKAWVEEKLSPEAVRATGLFNPQAPLKVLEEHLQMKKDNHRQLWTLIAFMLWFESYGSKKN